MIHRADVLIVTVTDVESRAVMAAFREVVGKDPKPEPIDDRIYLDLGEVKGARVFMALSEMGSGGVGGSQKSVDKGIEALSPVAVIMVGIAFGINESKQSLGDILVSQQLLLYDVQRVGKDQIIPRGDKPHASSWLINWLQVARLGWDEDKAKVRFGVVLSGDKLVDNIDYRNQLKQFESEAIGGEMEGAGVYVASQDSKVDWILVKSICDWADGQKAIDKQSRQQLAAHNAAAFILHALQQSSLKRDCGSYLSRTRFPATSIVSRPFNLITSSLPSQPLFFGRERELAIIAEAITPEARTWGALIDGPGGIGKTALAIHAAHNAPNSNFDRKIFLSAKVRELTPQGEQRLEDFVLPDYMALLTELGHELGDSTIEQIDPKDRPNSVRRTLARARVLIVIDNVETFPESERGRLYHFLSRLPATCKAIVTSRRRADIDARVIRLDRLDHNDVLNLLAELAKNNRHLQKASECELGNLYEITNGNPLLLKWAVGQLGREGSHCRSVSAACQFLRDAPTDNDPLEYIFDDLVDTFTESEMTVLAALAHFKEPARVKFIADVTRLAQKTTLTALEDLTDRALLLNNEEDESFLLPALAAKYLHKKQPELISETGHNLIEQAYSLAHRFGYENYDLFPVLEAEWPILAAALPLFEYSDNATLQEVCHVLNSFLHFSGRWDERLNLNQQAEKKAVLAEDRYNAGARAYHSGYIYFVRKQGLEVLACADRGASYWKDLDHEARSVMVHLRGQGHFLLKEYAAATKAFEEALKVLMAVKPESQNMATVLCSMAEMKREEGDLADAEHFYEEALRIAAKNDDLHDVAYYKFNLANLALDRNAWQSAEALARDAMDLAEKFGGQEMVGQTCRVLATALAKQGNMEEGLFYGRCAVEMFSRLRMSWELAQAQAVLKECGG